MHQSGFSPTLFKSLLISSDQVQAVIGHSSVKAVTLTGSKSAGGSVAAHAGKMIKPSLLELGDSDPYLILADADLDLNEEASVAGACSIPAKTALPPSVSSSRRRCKRNSNSLRSRR